MKSLISALPVSLTIGLGILGYGLYLFLTQWSYSESGHEYLLAAYVIGAVMVFFALRLSKIGIGVFLILCLVAIMFYSNQKFEWRQSYIQAAEKGNYFPLDQYIDEYPSFEKHHFAWLFDEPRWVSFVDECYKPLLKSTNTKNSIGRNCKSAALINDFYGVDVRTMIHSHYRKMQSTATQLEKGKFKNKRKLESCIQNNKCAMIPLLPASAEGITQQSEEHLDIRKQFWSLINDKKMSAENCDFFDLCRVMTQAEIITLDKM